MLFHVHWLSHAHHVSTWLELNAHQHQQHTTSTELYLHCSKCLPSLGAVRSPHRWPRKHHAAVGLSPRCHHIPWQRNNFTQL